MPVKDEMNYDTEMLKVPSNTVRFYSAISIKATKYNGSAVR